MDEPVAHWLHAKFLWNPAGILFIVFYGLLLLNLLIKKNNIKKQWVHYCEFSSPELWIFVLATANIPPSAIANSMEGILVI